MEYAIYNKNCLEVLNDVSENSVDCIITDPPYGIKIKNEKWDQDFPDENYWEKFIKVLKPGGFCAVFSSVLKLHKSMTKIENGGFIIKDVLIWVYLNGMPKSQNIGLSIDKEIGSNSKIVGEYKYINGYKKQKNYKTKKSKKSPSSEIGKKYDDAFINLKPAYEPIILAQKPLSEKNIAMNVIKHGTGVLNIKEARIPYEKNEKKVGHNPNPLGRYPSNIIRTMELNDGYDKFFIIKKDRKIRDQYNHHPTLKPVTLMKHLVRLLSFENQLVMDPFMGSGSTGVAAIEEKRKFIGYEINPDFFEISKKRLETTLS